eukprot:321916_1
MSHESTFTWSIGPISNIDKGTLCCGYTRENCMNYVPMAIIKLLGEFYSTDLYTINDIKNAKPKSVYLSRIFSLHSLTWYFEFRPNGCNDNTIGWMYLYICLLSFPSNINNIFASYTISLKEISTNNDPLFQTFTENKWYAQCPFALEFNDIQSLNTLTIEIKMSSVVINPHIELNPTPLSFPFASYKWSITDASTIRKHKIASNCYGFFSPIFILHGFKWYFMFFPNGSRTSRKHIPNIFLALASIPSPESEVPALVNIYFKNYHRRIACKYNMKTCGKGITGMNIYSTTNDLLNMDKFEFVVDMWLDEYGCTGKYIHTTTSYSHVSYASKEYIWNISEQKLNELRDNLIEVSSRFNMYGLEWILSMDINGNIWISLVWNDKMKCEVISTRCYVSLLELDARDTLKVIFAEDHNRISWGKEKILIDEFNELKKCTIIIEMELIDVYCEGENITPQFGDVGLGLQLSG